MWISEERNNSESFYYFFLKHLMKLDNINCKQACYTEPLPKMKIFRDNRIVSSDYQPMKYILGTFQPKWFNLITNHVKYISGRFQPKVVKGIWNVIEKVQFGPFLPNLGKTGIFPWNLATSIFYLYGLLTSCKVSE